MDFHPQHHTRKGSSEHHLARLPGAMQEAPLWPPCRGLCPSYRGRLQGPQRVSDRLRSRGPSRFHSDGADQGTQPCPPGRDQPCSLMMVMFTRRRPRVAVPTGTSIASTSSCFSSSSSGRMKSGTRTSTSSTPSWNSTMPRASRTRVRCGSQGRMGGRGGGAGRECFPTLLCSEGVVSRGHLEFVEGSLLHLLLCQLQECLLG